MNKDSACKRNGLNNFYTRKSDRLKKYEIILTLVALISRSLLTSGLATGSSKKSNGNLSPSDSVNTWRRGDFSNSKDSTGDSRVVQELLSRLDDSAASRNYDSGTDRNKIDEYEYPFLYSLAVRDPLVKERDLIESLKNSHYIHDISNPNEKRGSSQKSKELEEERQQQNEICSKLGGDAKVRPRVNKGDPMKDLRDLGHVEVIAEILEAISGGVSFMGREYKKVNLDAILGTRILEGTNILHCSILSKPDLLEPNAGFSASRIPAHAYLYRKLIFYFSNL